MQKRLYILTSLLLVAIGIATLATGLLHRHYATRSLGWDLHTGEVETSDVREHFTMEGGGRYEVVVVYRYEAFGSMYSSDRFSYGNERMTDRETAQTIADQFLPGAEVDVYVNPKRPSQSVMLAGDSSGLMPRIVLGLIFILISTIPLIRVRLLTAHRRGY